MTSPINTIEGPLVALREEEIALITEVATTLSELGDISSEDNKRLMDVAQDLRDMFFIVAVIGEFNAGKSTFVNALIGEDLLPTGIKPTTEFIELIRHNETPDRKPMVREDGIREWKYPNTGADGVAIVDTPGTGSVFQKHEKTAKDFLHRSDLVVFVISAKRAFAESERLYLELAKDYGKKIILVVNQVDLLNEAERADVRRFVESQVKELLNIEPLIFMVSAKQAIAGETNDSGLTAVQAHLRGVYEEAPPSKQKLLAQLDTTKRLVDKYQTELSNKSALVSADITKVQDVKQELQEQSLGLEAQMKSASSEIDVVLAGIRQRGNSFIDENLTVRKIGRSVNKEKLQADFQEVVIGRSLRDINNATSDYINAVIDQSRLYWRGVIERLNKLQDLMEQELGGLDSGVYSEQRESLQNAIDIAESELKAYSTGKVVAQMEETFSENMSGLWRASLASIGGVVAMIAAIATQGPLIGVGAAPLALPAFIIGATATAIFSVPTIRYFRRVTKETKAKFNESVNKLETSYHQALDDLTTKERNRLTQYGNQILTPIFSRLEVLAKRYEEQLAKLGNSVEQIAELKNRIQDA